MKKILSVILSILMFMTMIPLVILTACAATVTPEVTKTTEGIPCYCAGGNNLYIVDGTVSGTAIYYMNKSAKKYMNPSGAKGDDLRNARVYAGARISGDVGNVTIRMTGGHIAEICCSGFSGSSATGDVTVIITDGKVSLVANNYSKYTLTGTNTLFSTVEGTEVSSYYPLANSITYVDSNWKLAGNPVVPSGETLTISDGDTFTVPEGMTLTNNGKIIKNGGKVTVSGTVAGNPIVCNSHSGGTATCAEKAICETCGKEYGGTDSDAHDIIIDKSVASDCANTGLTQGEHCTRCSYKVEQEIIPALNHKGTLVQVDAKAPTCTENGWDAYEYCTACDYSTYAEKEALKHDIVIDEAVAPKCGETGLTAGQHCSRCDDMTIAQEVVPEFEHKDENGDCICDNNCGYEFPEETCEDCGRVHTNFFSEIICLFTRIFNFIKNLFA